MAVPFKSKAIIGLLITIWIVIDYRYRNLTVKLALVTDLMLLKKLYFPHHKPPSLRKDCKPQTTSDDANLKSHKPLSQRSIVIHHVLSNRHKLNKAREHKAAAHNKKNEWKY